MIRTVTVLALMASVAALSAQAPSEQPRFEVASIKPNTDSDGTIHFPPTPPDGMALHNHPLESIIRYAYDVLPFLVRGMPQWANAERFDITAKAGRPITEDERRQMARSLLIDRFRLRTHLETREQTAYVLTALKEGVVGSGLRPRPDCATTPCQGSGSSSRAAGVIRARGMTLDRLADGPLSLLLGQVVRNETNIGGPFDVELSFRGESGDPNDDRASLFTAVEEQFGLKLTPERRAVEILVIDSVEWPTPD